MGPGQSHRAAAVPPTLKLARGVENFFVTGKGSQI